MFSLLCMVFLFWTSGLIHKKSGVLFAHLNDTLLYLNSLDKTCFNAAKTKALKNIFKVNEWIQVLHILLHEYYFLMAR